MRVAASSIHIVVPKHQQDRLLTTAFRGKCMAGCISKWPSARAMAWDHDFRDRLRADVMRLVAKTDDWPGAYSVTFTFPEVIGWSSTVTFEQARGLPVALSHLNTHATAYFVDDLAVPAPRTRRLTLVFELREPDEEDGVLVAIQSVYPGRDIGKLAENVSLREGVVFFSWDAPGDDVIDPYWRKDLEAAK